ncbi:hypothetical protein ABPG77_002056 [Micractinium sp. CCAP 211/92]
MSRCWCLLSIGQRLPLRLPPPLLPLARSNQGASLGRAPGSRGNPQQSPTMLGWSRALAGAPPAQPAGASRRARRMPPRRCHAHQARWEKSTGRSRRPPPQTPSLMRDHMRLPWGSSWPCSFLRMTHAPRARCLRARSQRGTMLLACSSCTSKMTKNTMQGSPPCCARRASHAPLSTQLAPVSVPFRVGIACSQCSTGERLPLPHARLRPCPRPHGPPAMQDVDFTSNDPENALEAVLWNPDKVRDAWASGAIVTGPGARWNEAAAPAPAVAREALPPQQPPQQGQGGRGRRGRAQAAASAEDIAAPQPGDAAASEPGSPRGRGRKAPQRRQSTRGRGRRPLEDEAEQAAEPEAAAAAQPTQQQQRQQGAPPAAAAATAAAPAAPLDSDGSVGDIVARVHSQADQLLEQNTQQAGAADQPREQALPAAASAPASASPSGASSGGGGKLQSRKQQQQGYREQRERVRNWAQTSVVGPDRPTLPAPSSSSGPLPVASDAVLAPAEPAATAAPEAAPKAAPTEPAAPAEPAAQEAQPAEQQPAEQQVPEQPEQPQAADQQAVPMEGVEAGEQPAAELPAAAAEAQQAAELEAQPAAPAAEAPAEPAATAAAAAAAAPKAGVAGEEAQGRARSRQGPARGQQRKREAAAEAGPATTPAVSDEGAAEAGSPAGTGAGPKRRRISKGGPLADKAEARPGRRGSKQGAELARSPPPAAAPAAAEGQEQQQSAAPTPGGKKRAVDVPQHEDPVVQDLLVKREEFRAEQRRLFALLEEAGKVAERIDGIARYLREKPITLAQLLEASKGEGDEQLARLMGRYRTAASERKNAFLAKHVAAIESSQQTVFNWKDLQKREHDGGSRQQQQQQKAAQAGAAKQKQPRQGAPPAAAALPEGLLGPRPAQQAQQAQRHEVGLPAALAPLKRERSSEPAAGPQQAAAQEQAAVQRPPQPAAKPVKEEPEDGEPGLAFEDTGDWRRNAAVQVFAAALGLAQTPLSAAIELEQQLYEDYLLGKEEGEDADYLQAVRNVYRSLSPESPEHRPLLPFMLLVGLAQPQDVVRFTLADLKEAEARAVAAMQRKPEGSLQVELEGLPPPAPALPAPAPQQHAQQTQQPGQAEKPGLPVDAAVAAAQAAAANINAHALRQQQQLLQERQATAAGVLQAMLPPQQPPLPAAPAAVPWAAGTAAPAGPAPPPPPAQQHLQSAAMDLDQ